MSLGLLEAALLGALVLVGLWFVVRKLGGK